MSHSYSQNYLHIVFSTKDRQKANRACDAAKALVVHGWNRTQPRSPGARERRYAGPRTSVDPVAACASSGRGYFSGEIKFFPMDE